MSEETQEEILLNTVYTEEVKIDSLEEETDSPSFREAKQTWIQAFEQHFLSELLRKCRGNISKAAREAKMDRRSLHRLIKKHRIKVPRH